jgi:hypothetical protein
MKFAIAMCESKRSLARPRAKQIYLSNDCRTIVTCRLMKKRDPQTDNENCQRGAVDLARRLARYRIRVEAEGRKRSLQVIDKAIRDAEDEGASGA